MSKFSKNIKLLKNLRSHLSSKLFLSFGISVMVAIAALNINLYRVEAYFYDARMRLKGSEKPSPDIALLVLGEKDASETISSEWTSIEAHTKALERLMAAQPKALVYLNKFDPTEIESKPGIAAKFVDLSKKAANQGTNIYFGTEVDLGGEVLPPYPLSLLPHAPAILHKDGTIFAEDKVMRRALLDIFNEPSIHARLAFPELSKEELLTKIKKLRGAHYYEPADSWHILTRYPENTAESSFPRVYFSDVLAGKNLDILRGKIVLIETLRRDSMNDYAFTPYSRTTYTNPRIVVQGAILDTIKKNAAIYPVPNDLDLLITFSLALALAFIAITMSPSRGVTCLAAFSAALFLLSLLLFKFGIWLKLVHPLLAMFFTYYLIVPYRAILEYKKRWEVQEKHDLLVQVEEMKGNFLSLMSHDLKTPVARIQGLAELVLRQGNLNKEQAEEMRQIITSTENLDKFISKILNLTKVESNEIKLQKRSRDINKVIEQCVQKLEFQAKTKNIIVELDLDTLFPIHVDVVLIIQVFTNIIDNAIKYSAPGTSVKISSKEVGDFIRVVVEDSGPGMDDQDRSQLFTKFFRGNNILNDQNKGSGLGLYLSKYFIELHEGSVIAESKKGIGSKFVIQLPIQGESV